ncbi:extracellular solute-binding protein [Paenibacillus sp. GCM10023252]|uniref:extracellular solute-binding protein n=1 Tax=Paenibacillus sp. GCM10023252 TaxID=3252649 RepID=UPI00360CFA76
MKKQASLLALTAAIALTSVLAGCSSSNKENETNGTNGTNAGTKEAAPTKFSITTINYSPDTPVNDNPIELEMEKRTNTKIDVTYLPSNNYGEKFNVMLASNELPDVLLTTYIHAAEVTKAIDDGAFWDLTPFLKDYPNIEKAYPKESIENSKVNGKVYGLPRPRPLVGGAAFPAIRKDWLDKLGLPMPTTMDELYTALKAFKEKDPDGNGKADTYGFTGSVAEGWMDNLEFVESTFHGFNNYYLTKDGEPTINRDFLESERDAILWLQRAYKEGVLAPDFAIMKGTQVIDMMKQGKVGMIPTSMDANKIGDMVAALRQSAPEANIEHVPTLISPSTGKPYAIKEAGFFGNYLISKKVPEEKVKAILKFFDYGATPEGMELASFGLKDVHFTVGADGKKATNDEFKKIAGAAHGNIWTFIDPYSRLTQAAPNYPAEYFERDKKVIDERLKHGVFYNNNGVSSETEQKFQSEIGKKFQDIKIQVILGKQPIEAWDKHVAAMKKDATMKKILEERDASYKELFGSK